MAFVRVCLPLLVVVLVLGSPCRAEGLHVGPFALHDHRGALVQSADFADSKCLVVAFLGTECPLAKMYGPRLQSLALAYKPQGVQFLAINANQQDSVTEIAAYAKELGITFPILKDPGQKVVDQFHATRTPEVFVLSPQGNLLYQGRVDDQYIVGAQRKTPQREDLKIALDEILAGKPVSLARTEATGCLIGRIREPKTGGTVTYSNQIAKIFQTHCADCHRSGEIGPFPLLSYEDARGWGDMIAEVVQERRMPPWHADPAHGKFSNDRSLTPEDRDLILAWVKDGCPEGDPAQEPPAKTFTSGWQLSRVPDQVFSMETPFSIPADAGSEGVSYQYFWVDTNFTQEQWVSEVEVLPGNRAVVHHIIAFVHPEGRKQKGRGDFLCAYVPGSRAMFYPTGSAKKIPAGAAIRFQVHYTPNGSPQTDLSRVGMVFADPASITHEVITSEVSNTKFSLAPQTDNQEVIARSPIAPAEVVILSMAPHMHVRGKSYKYELISTDGQHETLLNVPRYDFNWQTSYRLAEPRVVPAGSRLVCTATYDNSAANPANPDPSQTVTWGDQSWEEMMLGYFDIIVPRGARESGGDLLKRKLTPDLVFSALDQNKDGQISRNEAAKIDLLSKAFLLVDKNRNDHLDGPEVEKAIEMLKNRR